jgi:hypothetical protein
MKTLLKLFVTGVFISELLRREIIILPGNSAELPPVGDGEPRPVAYLIQEFPNQALPTSVVTVFSTAYSYQVNGYPQAARTEYQKLETIPLGETSTFNLVDVSPTIQYNLVLLDTSANSGS